MGDLFSAVWSVVLLCVCVCVGRLVRIHFAVLSRTGDSLAVLKFWRLSTREGGEEV